MEQVVRLTVPAECVPLDAATEHALHNPGHTVVTSIASRCSNCGWQHHEWVFGYRRVPEKL